MVVAPAVVPLLLLWLLLLQGFLCCRLFRTLLQVNFFALLQSSRDKSCLENRSTCLSSTILQAQRTFAEPVPRLATSPSPDAKKQCLHRVSGRCCLVLLARQLGFRSEPC